MTYCLGIKINEGLVLVSDSRTNAGPDSLSAYSKMRRYGIPGERQFFLCSAGNLATSQAVFTALDKDMREAVAMNLNTVASVDEAATYIGELSLEAQAKVTGGGPAFESSFLLGGEVLGDIADLKLIYPEGNHISSSRQTPFLQVGESKYGKPILDRVLTMDTNLDKAALCALVSMDATMRSNVTVAPPIELVAYTLGSLQPGRYRRYLEDSEYLRELKVQWDRHVIAAFTSLPMINWQEADQP